MILIVHGDQVSIIGLTVIEFSYFMLSLKLDLTVYINEL